VGWRGVGALMQLFLSQVHGFFMRILSLVFLVGLLATTAQGSPVGTRLDKVYKQFIIQGERPEISSCMAIAFKAVRENAPYEAITYPDDVQDSALVQEDFEGEHMVKLVTISAEGLPRKTGFYLSNTPEKIQIVCYQIDEGVPIVKFNQVNRK